MSKTTYQIIYWRDIPAQVKAQVGRGERASRQLAARFGEAIDQAAMRAGLIGSDDYLNEWRKSEWHEREGSPADVAEAVAGELEAAYPEERLREMARNSGQAAPPG